MPIVGGETPRHVPFGTKVHGIGVSAPMAAAVAAATVGFPRLLHIPKVLIFKLGMKSIMVATNRPEVSAALVGKTMSGLGAIP